MKNQITGRNISGKTFGSESSAGNTGVVSLSGGGGGFITASGKAFSP
ncbi:MAG: hypothetical protein LBK53_09185 [Heliobacteriaceae bacterium]|jgi:hypothetical protein|nr:hypothetical protein [Heliobacteriaceae bacterium]